MCEQTRDRKGSGSVVPPSAALPHHAVDEPASLSSVATQFRKKPVVIEAFRLGDEWPDWWADKVSANEVTTHNADGRWRGGPDYALIHTLEGVMRAEHGDWIIKGVKGELYPCKPDVFPLTYDPVAGDADAQRFRASALLKAADNWSKGWTAGRRSLAPALHDLRRTLEVIQSALLDPSRPRQAIGESVEYAMAQVWPMLRTDAAPPATEDASQAHLPSDGEAQRSEATEPNPSPNELVGELVGALRELMRCHDEAAEAPAGGTLNGYGLTDMYEAAPKRPVRAADLEGCLDRARKALALAAQAEARTNG